MTRAQGSFFALLRARALRLFTAMCLMAIGSNLPWEGFGASRAAAQAEGAADQAAAEDPAQSRSAAFQAVAGSPTEDIPGGPLLVYAYAFILAAAVAYVARLGRLQGKNRAELERLGRLLERARKD